MSRLFDSGNTDILVSDDGLFVYVANQYAGGAIFQKTSGAGTFHSIEPNRHDGLVGTRAGILTHGHQDLYTVNTAIDAVYHYTRDAQSGLLTYVQRIEDSSTYPELLNPRHLTTTQDETFLVVSSVTDDSLVVFARDPIDGSISYSYALKNGTQDSAGTTVTSLVGPFYTALNSIDTKLVSVNYDSDSLGLFSFDDSGTLLVDGVLDNNETLGSTTISQLDGPRAVSFTSDGQYFVTASYVSDSVQLFADNDVDEDGYSNDQDVFPMDPSEHLDSDGDGIGDNSDPTPYGDADITISFSTDSTVVTPGDEIVLTWNVTGATTVSISPTIGSVQPEGSQTLTINQKAIFELTATSQSEMAHRYVTINTNDIGISISNYMDGQTVTSNVISIEGAYSGPVDSAVNVNGVPAVLKDGYFLVDNLRLNAGANSLTATIKTGFGLSAEETITINSIGSYPSLVLSSSNTETVVGEEGTLQWELWNAAPLQEIEVDFEDDGIYDYSGTSTSIPFVYENSGIYRVKALATDSNGDEHIAYLNIVVNTIQDLEVRFNGLFSDFKHDLINNNAESVASKMSMEAAQKYQPIFAALQNDMERVLSQFGSLSYSAITSEYAEFVITKSVNGTSKAYFIYFMKDKDGIWKITSL